MPGSNDYTNRHRFPSSHSCSPIARPTTTEKNARARELLKKNFPQSSSGSEKQTTSRIVRSRNTAAAQAQIMKVQSMKIRQTARPGDPKTTFLRPSERHNVLIKFDETNTEKTLWFDKVGPYSTITVFVRSLKPMRSLFLLEGYLTCCPDISTYFALIRT